MRKCRAKVPELCRKHGTKAKAKNLTTATDFESYLALQSKARTPKAAKSAPTAETVVAVPAIPVVKVSEAVHSLSWDEEVAAKVYSVMPNIKPTASNILSARLSKLAKIEGVEIDYGKFSPQSLASQMGNVLESVYEVQIQNHFKDVEGVTYLSGTKLSKEIAAVRKSEGDEQKAALKKKLVEEYLFNSAYAQAVIYGDGSSKPRSIHLPDAILIDRRGSKPVIRVGEMKASGQNDSSSVPENIDKMVYGTRNSAVEPWRSTKPGQADRVTVERAILITASTVNRDGGFTHKGKWSNEIANASSKHNRSGLLVLCNQEVYTWFTNESMTAKDYDKKFITTAASVELKRIMKAQNHNS